MTRKKQRARRTKISPGFAARLERLSPKDRVQAIVLLRTRKRKGTASKRQDRSGRETAVNANRRLAEQALGDVDNILARFDGQRLKDRPDVLGSIPVETTTAGIKALASSRWVKAVLEDQEIHLIT